MSGTSYAHDVRVSLRERLRALAAGDLGPLPVIVGLAAVWIFFQTQNGNFLTSRNLSNLTLQMAVTAILAMAVALVMISGEIDLSLGSVTGVTSALLGILLTNHHWSTGTALAATFALGLGIGLLQGAITVFVGVPSFLVTLGGFLAWAGVQLALIGPAGNLPVNNNTIASIGNSYLGHTTAWVLAVAAIVALAAVEALRRREWQRAGAPLPLARSVLRVVLVGAGLLGVVAFLNGNFGVPYVLVLFLSIAATLGWVTRRTFFGRYVYAVGGNAEASRRAGVPVGAIRIAVLGVSGLLAGLAGVVSTSNLYATSASTGGSILLLEAIAAAVIGGTSLFGGRGRIYQALLGTLVIASVHNGLGLLGKPASTEDIATGSILVLAVSLDALNRRRRAATGT
ncbi:MAG: inner-rane translocator [Actinomycetia bacterium]|nr:inner-rane translocator [Actinomycetes bacterium]